MINTNHYLFITFFTASTPSFPKIPFAICFILCLITNLGSDIIFNICSKALLSSSVSVKTSSRIGLSVRVDDGSDLFDPLF